MSFSRSGWALKMNNVKVAASEAAPQDRPRGAADHRHHRLQERLEVLRRPAVPRLALGGPHDLERPHLLEERIDAPRLQGRVTESRVPMSDYDVQGFYDGLVKHGLIVPVRCKGCSVAARSSRTSSSASTGSSPSSRRTTARRSTRSRRSSTGRSSSAPTTSTRSRSSRGRSSASSASEKQAQELSKHVHAGEPWGDTQAMTDVCLNPAACYPVYPVITGVAAPKGRLVTMTNWVYRHEPSPEPTRMQSFRVREFVRAGDPDDVIAWRNTWLERGLALLTSLGLPATPRWRRIRSSDAGGRCSPRARSSRSSNSRWSSPSSRPTDRRRCARSTTTRTTSSRVFGIRTQSGAYAHTACLGFGLERVVMALFKTHGFDPSDWPDAVRAGCGREPDRRSSEPRRRPPTRATLCTRADRAWVEKNCYVDIWIEVIHALGLEPTAMLPFVLALDFEGDQWTFFKPPHDELRDLYGIDVQELNVWSPLAEHCQVQLAEGKLDQHGGGRVLPPRHRGDRLPAPAHEDDDRRL